MHAVVIETAPPNIIGEAILRTFRVVVRAGFGAWQPGFPVRPSGMFFRPVVALVTRRRPASLLGAGRGLIGSLLATPEPS